MISTIVACSRASALSYGRGSVARWANPASRFATRPGRGTRVVLTLRSERTYGSSPYGRPPPMNLGVHIVPQQSAWIIERFGKYSKTLEAGLHFLIPLVDKVAYVHSLKEEVILVPGQTAITRDNVALHIDGLLYARIHDPYQASYGVGDSPFYAVEKLAQTTMRSEIGKITLDKTFEEREVLSANIVENINSAAHAWGVTAMRYEIQDISPPQSVKLAMDLQAEAERRKRAAILESEGEREADINIAEGRGRSTVVMSEARLQEAINLAKGEVEAVRMRAEATSYALSTVSSAIRADGGDAAVSLRVAEQYVAAFGNLAKQGNTVIIPADANDASKMVTQALGMYAAMTQNGGRGGSDHGTGARPTSSMLGQLQDERSQNLSSANRDDGLSSTAAEEATAASVSSSTDDYLERAKTAGMISQEDVDMYNTIVTNGSTGEASAGTNPSSFEANTSAEVPGQAGGWGKHAGPKSTSAARSD